MYLPLRIILFLPFISKGDFQETDVTFYLFASENRGNHVKITPENAGVNQNSSIVFLIHGWCESREVQWYEDLKNTFLLNHNITSVIQVDWEKPASQFYPAAVYDTSHIGKLIAQFIINLIANRDVSIQNIHICGHSLGAQIAGFIGKSLQTQSLVLPRITALDPAGPFYEGFFISHQSRLTRYDAEVVVVVHTDAGKLGYFGSCGTVDIYPNGGTALQPGCPDLGGGSLLSCSHQRSHQFFIDALERPGTLVGTSCWNFEAFKAGSCMGNRQKDVGSEFSEEDEGNYYLVTYTKKPYGLGTRWAA